ncbi:DUF1998 domain-containing protein [Planotetraspora phitsanulokensis]|uniref:MrfA-like Zn-binding domain-containing protein n=1 Tax=Planotetraspora phitsanulokensis TaxID=575192 RepID=A0A8J3U1U4_9ACTN|nr:DUF1998 domain-containing protein [Planotetraspora phitsanulokensis]GII37028.1 hypothetical protein Pph01_20310 [Planotetraspora phitsanulokensis]
MALRRRVRQSQTIFPFGVGGIFDQRGESFTAVDIRHWPQQAKKILFPRLAKKLNVDHFRGAPVAPSGRADPPSDWPRVPYFRFPAWLFCDHCRRMYRWSPEKEEQDQAPICPRCAPVSKLVPMRFIQICSRSHMSDVDWSWWAHSTLSVDDRDQCPDNMRLKFTTSKETSGLDSLRVSCINCPASRSLHGVGGDEIVKKLGLTCRGRQPWQPISEADECQEQPQIVQRGAANVYFPVIYGAIDIPALAVPSDVEEGEESVRVKSHNTWTLFLTAPAATRHLFRQIISVDCGVPEEFVEHLATFPGDADEAGSESAVAQSIDLDFDEWRVFTTPADERPTTKNFVTRDTTLSAGISQAVGSFGLSSRITGIVLADRIREVRALTGFSRHSPGINVIPAHMKSTRPKWFPGVETFGEGIFLAFDEQQLSEWEASYQVKNHVEAHEADLSRSFQQDLLRDRSGTPMLPRYPLLHTFAHLLIRQLSFESGYNTASLRERVYARVPMGVTAAPMGGILIYTAAGDAEGTLGGLVRQGTPSFLTETLVRALEASAWCSNDPLCSENSGQGLGNLNRAACHACALLPETSCEAGNALLDRTLVTGNGIVQGFFEPVLNAARADSATEAGS